MSDKISINRAPVLTLWAAVCAKRLGYEWAESLTLGRAVAGMSAQVKGRSLGLFEPSSPQEIEKRRQSAKHAEQFAVRLLGRDVPVVHTPEGIRALDRNRPASPASVERYLNRFGDSLPRVQAAMERLANSMPAAELNRRAFSLYETFRPEVPSGTRGWGAAGELDLKKIEELVQETR